MTVKNAPPASHPRLNMKSLPAAKPGAVLPAYDRSKTTIGVVHFGPGAFHRGHQACYYDSLLAHDPRWAICGAELLPVGFAARAVPQDYLYVVAELDAETRFRVVGSHKDYLTAVGEADKIFERLIMPQTKLVSMTVTEKGYCLDGTGALDFKHPGIVHDVANPSTPTTLVGWVTEGLVRRKAAGQKPFIVMSCDNMVSNGHKLRGAVLAFAEACGKKDLRSWIENEVRFPSTMVDSITPAADEALLETVENAVGLRDEAPVQRENFLQWVVEDILGEDGPDLGRVGASLTHNVAAYEFAKLRLLNGAHSTLAYAGLLLGYDSIGAAMGDARLVGIVERMMREDMVPTLQPTPGLEFSSYIDDLLRRFRNPALTHKLYQIASDGSQKLPYRILAPVADALKAGRTIERFAVGIAAWMRFVSREAKAGRTFQDPLSPKMVEIGKACTGSAKTDLPLFLALKDVFSPELAANPKFQEVVGATYEQFDAILRYKN